MMIMKNYNKYICAFVLLLGLSVNAWGYTATFHTGMCNTGVDPVAESSNGDGIEFPDGVTPTATGWEFVGWAEASCTETTTAPELILPGDEKTLYSNKDYYAVYRKYTTGTSTATFAANDDGTNIVESTLWLDDWREKSSGIELWIESGQRYTTKTPYTWSINKSDDDWHYASISAYRKIKKIDVTLSDTYYKIDDGGYGVYSDNDTYSGNTRTAAAASVSTDGLSQTVTCEGLVSGDVTKVLLYATEDYQIRMTTFTVTYYNAKFSSNPSDTEVALTKGTQTNATISSFSPSDVPTCSSTATDRNVTITVEAATGYEFLSTARLTYSGDGTASYVSGPTGSGSYTFVYRFAQNDNGDGTFSVTSASPKTYTINLDGNTGTGHTSSVTATYNSSTLSSSITNPTREGYTFDGWYSGSGGTGSLVISTGGALQANVTNYTGASGIWTKDANTTLYAKWTINKYKVTLAEPSTVTISATSPSSIAEGGNASIDYNTEVTLSYSSLVGGRQWCGWKVYKDGDPSTTVTVTSNKFNVPAYDVIVTAEVYGDFTFSCADLQLDEPDNGSDNVLSDVIYLTSTNGQKVRSAAHFRVHGDGLTPSQTVKFTTGDDDLDELYTFRKGDGTEVATNASGEVDEEVYIFYQPTAITDGRDEVTSLKAYVERKGDGSGKPKAVVNDGRTINGRHLPSRFIIAAKSGGVWYALPSDAFVTGAQMGYTFTPDNATTPTKANVAPANALYALYAPTADGTNLSYIRLASTSDSKTFWSNNSTSKIGIKNYAAIDGGSAKGNQYEWRLENTGKDSYKLYNNASNGGAGRYLGITGTKWNVYATGGGTIQDLKILPVDNVADYIGLTATDWEEKAFCFTITSGTPPTAPSLDHIQVGYNGKNYAASISGSTLTITAASFLTDGGWGAASGSQLLVEWCNSSNAVLAQGSVLSPIIISSNTTNLSDYDAEELAITDVYITNKAKLTINTNTTVHDVTVTSGATLFIDKAGESTGATLTLSSGKLSLRGGWNSGYSSYDMPRVYINSLSSLAKTNTAVNFDISVDSRNYYPFAVPFPVAVSAVDYVNPTLAGASQYGKHYVIKEYDGAWRAENGVVDDNWKIVNDGTIYGAKSDTLKPGKGYILTGVSVPAYGGGVIRFPMSFANAWTTLGEQATDGKTTKNVLTVTHHTGAATEGGGANKRHEGWNMMGVPFMSCYTSGTDMYDGEESADLMEGRMTITGGSDPFDWETGDVVYVSVPTHDFSEYIQTDITEAQLVPGWSFFIQVGTTGNLTFLTTQQREDSDMPIYAPQRTTDSTLTKIRTGVILSSESGEASDKFGLIISDRYTSDYEVGADLEKLFGNGYTLATYSLSLGTRLAFNALSTADAAQVIPVGYRAPADGQYTFALNPRYPTDGLLRLELIDYQTGDLTDLLTSSYTFTTARTQDDTRFAIHAVYTDPAPATPTGAAPPLLNPDEPLTRKFILNGQLYIQRGQTIYDASGKEVRL